jgi:hypothetical protein
MNAQRSIAIGVGVLALVGGVAFRARLAASQAAIERRVRELEARLEAPRVWSTGADGVDGGGIRPQDLVIDVDRTRGR